MKYFSESYRERIIIEFINETDDVDFALEIGEIVAQSECILIFERTRNEMFCPI
jgi:hypothetical protein